MCRIRVKTGHKGFFCSDRIRFVISPTRLALFSIFFNFSEIKRGAIGGRPRRLSRTVAAFMPAVTRSLISDDSNSAMAPMMVNIARPMRVDSGSVLNPTLSDLTSLHFAPDILSDEQNVLPSER